MYSVRPELVEGYVVYGSTGSPRTENQVMQEVYSLSIDTGYCLVYTCDIYLSERI